MCGIFGFITRNGGGPDLDRLRRIAEVTQRRGRHAFGLAWHASDGRLHTFKRPGPVTDQIEDLDRCRGATIVVGHCRWATHGSPDDNRNNHPHPAGRGFLVHNGVVRNHEALIHRYHLSPHTSCDSEVLGLLVKRFAGSLVWRAAQMARVAQGPLAVLGVWRRPARLLVVRRGNPLCVSQTEDGFYFASLPYQLPGRVRTIRDGSATVLTLQDGRLQRTACRVPS